MTDSMKQRVPELLSSIETGDTKPVDCINPNRYIQRNPAVADGMNGFVEVLRQLPLKPARAVVIDVIGADDLRNCKVNPLGRDARRRES